MALVLSLLKAIALFALLAALMVGCQSWRLSQGPAPTAHKPETLRIATHNVHYIVLGQTEGRWSQGDFERRKPALDTAFKALDADIVAFQEMESFARGSGKGINLALDHLLSHNPEYAAAAVGDPAVFPSTQPFLYRRDRFTVLDQGWFFFSETPDVIYSRTFNGSWPAYATWARFRAAGDNTFRILNLHTDAFSSENRTRTAALVAERMTPWVEAGETVFLVGDTNERAGSRNMEVLAAPGLTFLAIRGSTFHFDRGINLFGAIDHIAHTPQATPVGPVQVYREKPGGVWPSDHYPVVADFAFPNGSTPHAQ